MTQHNQIDAASLSAGDTCPNCGGSNFAAREQTVQLRDTLERWEQQAELEFSPALWQSYDEVMEEPVTLYGCGDCTFEAFLPTIVGNEAFYSEITGGEQQYYTVDKWEFTQAIGDLRRQKSRRILDFGCGSGAFLSEVTKRLPVDAFGFDLNPAACEIAKRNGIRMIESLEPDQTEPFDAICMFQILEHLADPIGTIAELRRLLKPGGILIVTVPDTAGPIRHFADAITEIPPHHVTRWREDSMRVCAARHDLDVVEFRHEPLPDYLWKFYLPVIIKRDLFPGRFGKFLTRRRIMRLIFSCLRLLKVRHLRPIRGHTLYSLLRA